MKTTFKVKVVVDDPTFDDYELATLQEVKKPSGFFNFTEFARVFRNNEYEADIILDLYTNSLEPTIIFRRKSNGVAEQSKIES